MKSREASPRDDNDRDARTSEYDRTAKLPGATAHSGSNGILNRPFDWFGHWVLEHTWEIVFAIVFAIPLAWIAAGYFDIPTYKIVVVEYGRTDKDTIAVFNNLVFELGRVEDRVGSRQSNN